MNLQIVSDLHLEFGPLSLPVKDTDVLIAAGDIDVGEAGIKWLQQFQCPVIYVAGNHEYWGEDLHDFARYLTQCVRGERVHYLEKRKVIINDILPISDLISSYFIETVVIPPALVIST